MHRPTRLIARKRADSLLDDTQDIDRKHKRRDYLLDGICGRCLLSAPIAADVAYRDDNKASWLLYQYVEDLADLGVYNGTGHVEPVYVLTPSSHPTARRKIRSMVRISEENRMAKAKVNGDAQADTEQHVKLENEEDNKNNSVGLGKMGVEAKLCALTSREIVEVNAVENEVRKAAQEKAAVQAAKNGKTNESPEDDVEEWYGLMQPVCFAR